MLLVRDAFNDFFSKLPLSDAAFHDVELDHIERVAKDHGDQQELLQAIRRELRTLREKQDELTRGDTYLDAVRMQQESSRPEHRNPFRIVKAEDFNHDYARLALLFREPSDYDSIRDPNNLIIAGGRGCGKSMILRSLSVEAALEIERLRRATQDPSFREARLRFADSSVEYFGVYVKLPRGYFYEWKPDCKLTEEAATILFQHVFNLLLLRSLVDQVTRARDSQLLQLSRGMEQEFVRSVKQLASFDFEAEQFGALLSAVRAEENAVGDYIGALRLGVQIPEYRGRFTYIHDFIPEVCAAAHGAVPELSGRRIYFLLDEYENLAEFQQKVVNTLAKLRPLSLTVKVATRALGVKSIVDLQGEPIQLPRDYHLIVLDYDVKNKNYRELLLEIARKRLEAEGFETADITALLEEAPSFHPSTSAEVGKALEVMLCQAGTRRSTVTVDRRKELLHQWGNAMVFRLSASARRRRPRTYAGFADFVMLSSGIVSNFLELCKMAFYLAEGEGSDVRRGQIIPWDVQNDAVYAVSKAYLDSIGRNIEDTGPWIVRWVLDLSDVFRAKLLTHTSEPEAARLALRDPEALNREEYVHLSRVLDDAVRCSVLHTTGQATAYFPKHKTDVRSNDFYLNRILSPILRLSPHPRWATPFAVDELGRLLDDTTRTAARNALIRKHSSGDTGPLFGRNT